MTFLAVDGDPRRRTIRDDQARFQEGARLGQTAELARVPNSPG
jgi:hypothetical protein